MTEPKSEFPTSAPARQARSLLAAALEVLQRSARSPELEQIIEHAASASSTLYGVEKETATLPESHAGIRLAVERLGHALTLLQQLENKTGACHAGAEIVAHALAVLYPIARGSLRQRRDVILEPSEPAKLDSLRTLANLPPAPESAGPPRRSTLPTGRPEQRGDGDRLYIEADIGLVSESHFYTGLSEDLSRGGVFIATYQPLPPDTQVLLYFVLPEGREVHALGVVRWTREGSDDAPPGVGVAFQELDAEDRAAIERFCKDRSPLYYDSDDD